MANALPLLKSGEYINFSSFFQSSANLDMVRTDAWRHAIAVLTRPFAASPAKAPNGHPHPGAVVVRHRNRSKTRTAKR